MNLEKPDDVTFDHRGCTDFNHNMYRLLKGQGILLLFFRSQHWQVCLLLEVRSKIH